MEGPLSPSTKEMFYALVNRPILYPAPRPLGRPLSLRHRLRAHPDNLRTFPFFEGFGRPSACSSSASIGSDLRASVWSSVAPLPQTSPPKPLRIRAHLRASARIEAYSPGLRSRRGGWFQPLLCHSVTPDCAGTPITCAPSHLSGGSFPASGGPAAIEHRLGGFAAWLPSEPPLLAFQLFGRLGFFDPLPPAPPPFLTPLPPRLILGPIVEENALKRAFAVILAAAAVAGCQRHRNPAPRTLPLPRPTTQETSATTVPSTRPIQPSTRPQPPIVQIPTPPTTSVQVPTLPTPQLSAPIAVVNGVEIPRDKVVDLVMDSYGLDMLLRVVQVEVAKQEAIRNGLTITPADVEQERKITIQKLFKDANQKTLDQIADLESANQFEKAQVLRANMEKDNQSLLQQLLVKQQLTPKMFDLQMESQACLRKIVEKQTEGKLTDQHVREAFNTLYGANVRIRHIQCANLGEIAQAQRRLAAGEPFETVARDLSRNAATSGLGGELPPFSRETPRIPQQFKDTAFAIKQTGEVSDPVEADGAYHLIKLIEKIPPKAVKFEDVKDSVREQLADRWVSEAMRILRDQLGRKTLESLQIKDPALDKQYMDRIRQREGEIKDRQQIDRQLERDRQAREDHDAQATGPTTEPTTVPATQPAATSPVTPAPAASAPATGELRPPATQSGSDTPDLPSTTPSAKP
jgi:parvulin-like peptidyl-prolyl isomerase